MTFMFMLKMFYLRDVREKILNKYCCYKELSNCYWELEVYGKEACKFSANTIRVAK